ncbi:hypothetical protein [Mycolicibacterium helvum]|nr:hypothetical protein [Mycolicibacterium helvum]
MSFAIAVGDGARASTLPGLLNLVWQQGAGSSAAIGALNLAIGILNGASGTQSTGVAGVGNIALQFGPGTMTNIGSLNLTLASATGGDGTKTTNAGGLGNLALNIGDAGTTWVQGFLSSATNMLGDSIVKAQGILTAAGNVLGNGNVVTSLGPFPNTTLSLAFNFFGDNNTVTAGWGPFAIAGAISQNLRTITRSIPGININGTTTTGTVSVGGSKKALNAAASRASITDTATASAAGSSITDTTTPNRGVGHKKTAGPAKSSAAGTGTGSGVGGKKPR